MSRAPLGGARDEARVSEVLEQWSRTWEHASSLLEVQHQPRSDDRGHFHWLVRLAGEEREVLSVWLSLRQRSVHVECEVTPAPEQNVEEIYRYVLTKNAGLRELHVALGPESGLYLVTHVPVNEFTSERLDEVIGAVAVGVDELYPTIMTSGFSWFRRRTRREYPTDSVEG